MEFAPPPPIFITDWLSLIITSIVVIVGLDRPHFAADHPKHVYIWAGMKHNITCRVRAHPAPHIEWLRNNIKLANNLTYTIKQVNETESNLEVHHPVALNK